MKKEFSRREFVKKNSLAGMGACVGLGLTPSVFADNVRTAETPAILGGQKIRTKGWPGWPMWIPETDEKQLLDVIRSGVWSRAKVVDEFEQKWAQLIGAKKCLTVVNGTNALIAAVHCLDLGAGDEIITTPFTFISSPLAVLNNGAIPVFADIDENTWQIDPAEIEKKITPRTKAILPVHIYGIPADMTRIMAIAKKHNLLVVEDACQGWLAEINNKKVGTFGNAGCFSFQNSKHIPMGEGGAIVSDDEAFMARCKSYHNFGGQKIVGTKLRLAEYQAAIGLAQLKRLEEQTEKRNANANYLRSKLKEIPGIIPNHLYPGVTKGSYHLFPFRYIKEEFRGMTRAEFIRAMSAEGIPCGAGYSAGLNISPFINDAFKSKNYQRMYSKEELDWNKYLANNKCPVNDRVCNEETVAFGQRMLLAEQSDMDDIIRAVEKIHSNAGKIKNVG
jgi:dTDP-4-amino-4,6-dideoxygalactose transaminase